MSLTKIKGSVSSMRNSDKVFLRTLELKNFDGSNIRAVESESFCIDEVARLLTWVIEKPKGLAQSNNLVGLKDGVVPVVFNGTPGTVNNINDKQFFELLRNIKNNYANHDQIIMLLANPSIIMHDTSNVKVLQLLLGTLYDRSSNTWSWLLHDQDTDIMKQINKYPCKEQVTFDFDPDYQFSRGMFKEYMSLFTTSKNSY